MEIRYGDQVIPKRAFVEFLSDSGREASYFTDGTNWNTEPGDIVGNLLALREKWKSQTGRPSMPKADAESLVERIEGMIAAGKVDRQQAEEAIAAIRRDAGLLPLPIVVSEAEKMAMIRDGVLQEFFGQTSRLHCLPLVVLNSPVDQSEAIPVVVDRKK